MGQFKIPMVNKNIYDFIYPINTVLIRYTKQSPAEQYGGQWEVLDEGYALWTTNAETIADNNRIITAGLPNITAKTGWHDGNNASPIFTATGAFASGGQGSSSFPQYERQLNHDDYAGSIRLGFDASLSNPIYGASDTVQPPAIKIYAYRRVA